MLENIRYFIKNELFRKLSLVVQSQYYANERGQMCQNVI